MSAQRVPGDSLRLPSPQEVLARSTDDAIRRLGAEDARDAEEARLIRLGAALAASLLDQPPR